MQREIKTFHVFTKDPSPDTVLAEGMRTAEGGLEFWTGERIILAYAHGAWMKVVRVEGGPDYSQRSV